MAQIKITDVDINLLNPAIYNPRKLSEKQEKDLTESLKRFSFVDPLIVNFHPERKNIIVGGHARYKVAKKLGYKTVPVVYVNLTLEKEQELNLRLNENGGSWDYELLKAFDISMLLDVGFEESDLSHIWDDQFSTEDDQFDSQKAVAKSKTTEIKTEDLFRLGHHYLLCGDSTNLDDIKKLVGKNKIDVVYSDPIYNINLSYDDGVTTKGKYGGTKVNDNKSDEDYSMFLEKTLSNALAVVNKDAHFFYYCDQSYIWLIQNLYKKLGIKNQRVCLWLKNSFNPTPQVGFNKSFEPCVYGTIGSPYLNSNATKLSEILNKEISTGNRSHSDIMDIFDIWLAKRKAGQDYLTPTEKPVTLHEKPLRRCSKPNDKVLDLFGGSGSTMVACEQMNRQAFLMEIDPVFCQVIVDRYQQLTGKEVVLCK